MIQFKTLKFRNFLSYGSSWTELDLDRPGINLVTGKNGAGKSTIAEAITFSLYGKPYRGVNKGDLVNRINGKNTELSLTFTIGQNHYKIERGISPDYVRLYHNDELVEFGAEVKEYQKRINKIIGVPYDMFCQIIILGFASYVPFLSLPLADRRRILDIVTGMSVLAEVLTVVSIKHKELESDVLKIDNQLQVLKQEITWTLNTIESIKNDAAKVRQEDREKLAQLQQQSDELTKNVAELQQKIEEFTNKKIHILSEMTQVVSSVVSDEQTGLAERKLLVASISNLEKNKGNQVCPHCFNPVDADHLNKVMIDMTKQINSIDAKIEQIQTKKKTLQKKMNDFIAQSAKVEKNLTDPLNDANKQLVEVNAQIKAIQEQKSVDNRRSTDQIKTLTGKIEENGKQGTVLVEQRKVVDTEKQLYDDLIVDLKDTGIRAYILGLLLQDFNADVTGLLQGMGMSAIFALDTAMKDKILMRGRDLTKYEALSAGERQRVDMAIMLALWQLASRLVGIETNLLYFDETLDASLDSVATEFLIDLLNDTGKSIYLVSHRRQDELNYQRHIFVEKINQFSVLKEIT